MFWSIIELANFSNQPFLPLRKVKKNFLGICFFINPAVAAVVDVAAAAVVVVVAAAVAHVLSVHHPSPTSSVIQSYYVGTLLMQKPANRI